ncbi:MAG: tRNA (cytidine(34)-2'-O)-methyltransferase [Thermoanaerobaculia bacterium]
MTTPPAARGFSPSIQVILVEPEIHWNTGNAGRTCLAAGAALHLVRPLGFSLSEREVRRAGLDYWPDVAPTLWNSWPEIEAALPVLGEPYFFSAEADLSYWDVTYPSPVSLVFGSESSGLPPAIRERYRDRLVRIPMERGVVRSLNLSTSVALATFEVRRQQRQR